jgi:glycosyltransferase involved in cell wall biosynthesis
VLHVLSYRRMIWSHPCALIATIHDLAAFHVSRKYDWKRMFYGRVVARQLAARQDQLIAISENTARDLHRFWKVSPERITVIHHGVDHHRFAPGPPGISKAVGRQRFNLHQPFFLYVARLEHPAKNHLRLIRAFERFKAATGLPWQLVLAGSDWHGARTIHDAIRASPARGDILCLGFVAADDLPMLYRAADAFVYPSLYEGFGFPPLEAMACGCPVLCSRRGALGEVIGDAAITIDPEHVTAMELQMTRLATDADLRGRLRMAGLQHAGTFSWARTASQTLQVYARAAAQAQTRSPALSPRPVGVRS